MTAVRGITYPPQPETGPNLTRSRLRMNRIGRHPLLSALLLVPLALCACASQKAPEVPLPAQLDQALGRGQIGAAHYTARVIDLSTGRELYSVDADTPHMPASNGKLAVSAATLDFFGSDVSFKTYLALDG